MKTILIAATAASLALVAGIPTVGIAQASPTPDVSVTSPSENRPFLSRVRQIFQRLGLSADQKSRIKATFVASAPQLRPLIKEMIQERRKLRDLIQSGQATDDQIVKQCEAINKVMTDLALERAALAREVRTVLSPEQIAEAESIKAEFQKKIDARLEQSPLLNPDATSSGL